MEVWECFQTVLQMGLPVVVKVSQGARGEIPSNDAT